MTRSASTSWPCSSSQRGLSGTCRRTNTIASPITAVSAKHSRHPTSGANHEVSSNTSDASDPRIVPSQNDPPITRSTTPRTRAGISSSTAEWIAEYSPPTPAPVMIRHTKNHTKCVESPVNRLPTKKITSVSMNSRRRPMRSAIFPKYSAPAQAPRIYAAPAAPTSVLLSASPLSPSLSRPPIAPTIVTAKPSSTHTVPSPINTRQCHRDHGNRSIRAGISVRIVRICGPPAITYSSQTPARRHHISAQNQRPTHPEPDPEPNSPSLRGFRKTADLSLALFRPSNSQFFANPCSYPPLFAKSSIEAQLKSQKLLSALPEVFVSTTEISGAVSRAMRDGDLRQLGPKVYSRNLEDPPEDIVRRHLWELVSALVPGALIADRTALELRPAPDGSVFIVSDRKRDIELPGLTIRPRKGPPALAGSDGLFIGTLSISSLARAYLDNVTPSRQRSVTIRRTMTREELEAHIEHTIRFQGVEAINKVRDLARRIAPELGKEAEFLVFDRLLSSLLGTHDAPLVTVLGQARQAGVPYDPHRLALFQALYKELREMAPVSRLAPQISGEGRTSLPFFEAYFSNFIEGTKFAVEEAADIVFRNIIPHSRPADAHDIMGTWRIVSDPHEMSSTPTTPQMLLETLKRRHAIVMTGRPEKQPGVLKAETNQAGSTVFVAPDLVEGTLTKGFDLYRALDTPFARAVYMMFLISEVHPFADGNGRTARIMMNSELVTAGEARIIIPTVLRDDYIQALKALSNAQNPTPLVRVLKFAQRWVAAVHWGPLDGTRTILQRCHAFLESGEAEQRGVSLRLPDHATNALDSEP